MSDDRFEQLMSRMPEIAQAVNAFQSESVQKLAFEMLVESLGLKPSAGRSRPAESAGKAVTGESLKTQDILAMARGGFRRTRLNQPSLSRLQTRRLPCRRRKPRPPGLAQRRHTVS